MTWVFLSLLSAFSLASADALSKRFFSDLSAYEMGLIRLLYVFPWLIAACFFIPWTKPDTVFFLCLVVGLPLEALAFYGYMQALKEAPLSLSLPFLAFTPAFIVLTGWMLLGETVSLTGLLGIFLIVAGSYCLNIFSIAQGYLAPFKAIFKARGSRTMLLVSFIYSLTAPIGKLGILHSNPYVFGVIYYASFILCMAAFLPFSPGAKVENLNMRPMKALILGAVVAVSIFSHWVAISQVQAAYMIALKRTSLLFGVLYGAFWFKEEKIRERLIGAGLMLIGVFCIGWLG